MIDNETRLNVVIGFPLKHTLSPLLHNYVYNKLNCNTVMLSNDHNDLSSIISALKTLNVGLVAVTMPFKREILQHLDYMSKEVKDLESANTVLCHDGKLHGYNTDLYGIEYAFRNTNVNNKEILIIGSGGASHAAARYFTDNKAKLFWLNRTKKNALYSIKLFGGTLLDIGDLHRTNLDIIVNATPLGLFPNVNTRPIPDYKFNSHQVVFDMICNPKMTLFLMNAKEQGALCISGLDMFIAQGLKQIELWLDKPLSTSDFMQSIVSEIEMYNHNSGDLR